MFDLLNNLDVQPGLPPVAATTDNTAYVSDIINLADVDGAMFVICTGSLADADATFTVLAQSGNQSNLSDATETPNDQLNGTEALASFTFAADNSVFKLGFRPGYKQYARVTITPANNTGNVFISGVWITKPKITPPPNPPIVGEA